jgi:hypothetical protein
LSAPDHCQRKLSAITAWRGEAKKPNDFYARACAQGSADPDSVYHHVGIGADCQQALKSKGTLIQRSARLFAARIRAIFRRGRVGQSDLLIARILAAPKRLVPSESEP